MEKYSDMLNMKALVGILIFHGKRAWIVPYLKGIWTSMEYVHAKDALGA